LVWLSADKGLELQGLELALRWPEGLGETATLLDVSGDLGVTDCTISVAARPQEPITLARVKGEAARCRFTRPPARGQALAALDLEPTGAEVLFDGCLVNGGNATMIRSRGSNVAGPKVYLVRSTLLGRALIEHRPATEVATSPVLSVLCWDSLLVHSGERTEEDGDLLTLQDRADARGVDWRAVTSLYVGWRNLLAGAETITAKEARKWRDQWKRTEGDESLAEAWPTQTASEPGTQPATAYAPTKPVGFASSVDADKPLGCVLADLPPCRDAWVSLALEPTLTPVDAPSESSPPEMPALDDGCYHGGKFDLTGIGLGAELEKKLKAMKPGPKVVLHLSGKGDSVTSPLRLKCASLVLYFEEPADEKAARPMLKLRTTEATRSLVEVEDGSVEVINGGLKVADEPNVRGAHLIRVKGGDVRLYRTPPAGPHPQPPVTSAPPF